VKTAKLPVEASADTPRFISELAIGETGHVALTALIVTPDKDCFLYPKQTLEEPRLLQMTVRRDPDGFHVVLPSEPKFTSEPLHKGIEVLPIASIAISKDKWTPGFGNH
jgi:hypothetical protein